MVHSEHHCFLGANLYASTASPAFIRDGCTPILDVDGVHEADINTDAAANAVVGYGDFYPLHGCDFLADVLTEAGKHLPETTTGATVADSHEFFVWSGIKPDSVKLVSPN